MQVTRGRSTLTGRTGRSASEIAWADRARLTGLIPGGVYGPVQAYLHGVLRESPR
ncbi:hypothetical protein ABZ746_26820 [Streptomyces sp. NPDC020096]